MRKERGSTARLKPGPNAVVPGTEDSRYRISVTVCGEGGKQLDSRGARLRLRAERNEPKTRKGTERWRELANY